MFKTVLIIPFLFLFMSESLSQDQRPVKCSTSISDLPKDLGNNSIEILELCTKREAWATAGAGGVLVLGVMSNDAPLQSLMQPSGLFKNNLRGISEAFGNPIYMGGLTLGTYALGSLIQNSHLQGLSNQALQSLLIGGATTMGLKLIFHRVRPEEQSALDPYQFNGPSLKNENLSFPSGHTTIAFALASTISAYYDDKWYVAIPMYTLAGLTAWQRVYDLKHWPSDIVAGALIGTFVGRTVNNLQKDKNIKVTLAPGPFGNTMIGMRLSLD